MSSPTELGLELQELNDYNEKIAYLIYWHQHTSDYYDHRCQLFDIMFVIASKCEYERKQRRRVRACRVAMLKKVPPTPPAPFLD